MDNNSFSKECSFDHIDTIMKYLQPVISIPTFFIGLVLNVLALRVFFSWKKQTETSIYMINLALTDLLLLVSLPLKMYYSTEEQPQLLCKFIEALYFVSMYGSIFIIVCISLDRYLAIRHPLKSKAFRSPRKAIVVCCCIWVIVWLSSIPIYDFHKNDKVRCFHNMSEQAWGIPIILTVEVFGFLIPLTLMVYCTIQIILTLWRRKNQGQKWAEQAAFVWIILANLMVFVVTFTPVHLGIFLQFLVRRNVIVDCIVKQNISLFIQVAMCVANVNCCLDAICYYFATETYPLKQQLFVRDKPKVE
uniref:G-protein coupled receptors family 1 profile domain-containing protein n=1 Tax=Pelusios castaneus TaxID=367368 RepID=A0A8C8RJ63_9SAUR